jgi:tetratricopeptide (TPR) repeat protein
VTVRTTDAGLEQIRRVYHGESSELFPDGEVFISESESLDAIPTVRLLIRDHPSNPVTWFALYLLLKHRAMPYDDAKPEMVSALDKLTELAPKFASGWICKGYFYSQLANSQHAWQVARNSFEIAARLSPDSEKALVGTAALCDKYGDCFNALATYQQLSNRFPDNQTYKSAVQELEQDVKALVKETPKCAPALAAGELGLFPARNDDKWGFVRPSGEVAIPFKFDDADNFSGGLARVGNNLPAQQDGRTAVTAQ